jgi:hypothetical protein
LRNRISSERVDNLMTIGCEGLPISQFNFGEVLNEWRQKKNRRILSKAVTSEENLASK